MLPPSLEYPEDDIENDDDDKDADLIELQDVMSRTGVDHSLDLSFLIQFLTRRAETLRVLHLQHMMATSWIQNLWILATWLELRLTETKILFI